MTATVPGTSLPGTPSDLPPVERRASLPAGFRAGGLAAGIKASGRPDLALAVTTAGPAAVAAVFTPNAFAAAPVRQSRTNLAATSGDPRGGFGWAQAVISTSGCANAATGAAGRRRPGRGRAPRGGGARHRRDATCSTSRPGSSARACRSTRSQPASSRLVAELAAPTTRRLEAAAVALRTTDSVTKVATTTVELPGPDGGGGVAITVTGIAKGVGMIHPNMATMLSVVLTDAAVEPAVLCGLLRPAAVRTWNQLSVDGDTSTNDTVFVLASGARRHGADQRGERGRARTRERPSRRSPATSPGSRPPTARARRPSSPPRCAGRGTTPMPGPSPAPSSRAAWSRPRPTARTRTGAASPARPATPWSPPRPSSRPPA